jgi:rubrerythrin
MDYSEIHVPSFGGFDMNDTNNDLSIAHDRLRDESEGAGRYQSMAEQAKDESLKALLAELATEELDHGKKLTAWIEGHPPKEEAQKSAPKSLVVEIAKVSDNVIYAIVLKAGKEDLQGDIMSSEDIKIAMHDYMAQYRTINVDHAQDINACPVECWQATQPGKLGNRDYGPGDWLMGTRIDDPVIMQGVWEGKYKSYSIEGIGIREPIPDMLLPGVS